MGVWEAAGLMALSFALLAKCADYLVEGAIDIARYLRAPPILIGIVIVGIGTTAPELAVSVTAALGDKPEVALGNAVGSVIYDDGLALPMAALFATAAIAIDRVVLRSAAIFLITVDLVAWYMASDGTLARVEGGALVGLFVLYLIYSFWEQKRQPRAEIDDEEAPPRSLWMVAVLFGGGLAGVVVSSHFIVEATPVVGDGVGTAGRGHCLGSRGLGHFDTRDRHLHCRRPQGPRGFGGGQHPRGRHPQYLLDRRRFGLGQSAGGSGRCGQFHVPVDAGYRAGDARVDALWLRVKSLEGLGVVGVVHCLFDRAFRDQPRCVGSGH